MRRTDPVLKPELPGTPPPPGIQRTGDVNLKFYSKDNVTYRYKYKSFRCNIKSAAGEILK